MADLVSTVVDEVDGPGIVTGKETEGLTDDMVRMLSLHRYSDLAHAEEVGIDDIEEWLTVLKEKILSCDSDHSMIWDQGPEEASEYLQVVNEVLQLDEVLQRLHLSNPEGKQEELLICAQSILQMAMARLEEELTHLLVQHRQIVKPKDGSFRSPEESTVDDFSSSSFDEESVEGKSPCDTDRGQEDTVIDLIDPHVIRDLNSIAKLMFLGKYDKECCQAYISTRRDALHESLSALGMEKLSIEEVLRMEWNALSCMMKMWNQVLRDFIEVYLASERRLCDLIFGELSRSVRESCFVEATKSSVTQLLSFAEATAISLPKSEKLFQILDMYEVLNNCLVHIEYFYPEDYGSSILTECQEVLLQLGEAVRGTIKAFKYAIQTNTSTTAFPGGGVHPLTKYVTNYIKTLAAYSDTLGLLLKDQHGNDQNSSQEHCVESSTSRSSALALHLKSITSSLESNLDAKSHLYNDGALKNIFMMNNIRYMVQKVKDSDLRKFLGDEWIRSHNGKFQQYAMNYQRASWVPVLSFLMDEGFSNSNAPSKSELKKRFKGFNLAFEEVYKTQTGWSVPDHGLRDDLKISISVKVLQAYRMFMGRYASLLDGERHGDRYIKYYPDDLEEYLLDLFAGSPKSLQYPRRR